MSLLVDFLASGTFRRAVAALVAVALPIINSKLGLNIPSEQIIAAIVAAAGYVAQSVGNEMHARNAGDAAAEKVVTVEDAAKVLGDKPADTKPPAIAPVAITKNELEE